MEQEKESPPAKGPSQEGLFRVENVGMDDDEEEEAKNAKLYNSEDEDEDGSPQKPPSPELKPTPPPSPVALKKHAHCSRIQERWPTSHAEHFARLRSRRHDSEKNVYSLEEDEELSISKTEKVTKDDLPIAAILEKKLSAPPPSPSTRVPGRSLPVSLKLQKRSVSESELNNNLDAIQPQFKELSLYSPNKSQAKKSGKCETFGSVKHLRFYVEVTCVANTGQGEILNISCEPLVEPTPPLVGDPEQDIDTSGHLGDVSKTISSLSSSPMSYIPPPPTHLARMSYVSSSSGSSFPGSAAALSSEKSQKNTLRFERLEPARVNYLSKKWKNSSLVYGLLDYVDKISCEDLSAALQLLVNKVNNGEKKPMNLDSVPEEVTPSNTRKRHTSPGPSPLVKRLKPSSPIASTSFDDLLGNEVFAKWQNRKYYFAHITGVLDTNHFQVVFLDTTVRTVTKDQIVNDLQALIGNKIMVTKETEGDKYFPGIATTFFVDDGVPKYSVLTDNGDFEAGMSQIYFTEHQAKAIKQVMETNAQAGSTDESRSTAFFAGCSGVQQDLSDQGSETDTSPPKANQDVDKHIMGCDIETNDPQNLNPSVKLKSVQGKLSKRSNKNEDILLGPLKSQGAWFKGLNFMITCSTRAVTSSTEEVQTDSEDYPFTSVPFVYDRLVQQIKLGGGEVYEKFDYIHPDQYNSTYLVTNRPCLTPKYLKCLAAGITIICHEWVVNSTIKQKRQPLINLPAGWSLEGNRFINMFDRKTSQPLSGLRIKLAQLTDQNFYKFWSNICNMAGGSASIFTGTFENTTVIVAENGLKDDMLDKAVAYGVPVVSATWIIQSIIHGEVRSYNGHPSYNHLYEEPED